MIGNPHMNIILLPHEVRDMNQDKIRGKSPRPTICSYSLKAIMNINILQTLSSNSRLSSIPISLKPSTITTTQTQNLLSNIYRARSIRISAVNRTGSGSSSSSNNGDNDVQQPVPPTITPPDTGEIRFRRRTRRQKQQRDDGINNKPSKVQASANTSNTPKNWEDKNLTEKAMELYMGEKGLLFWLNKFAYASIFIMIGAWILFRFVGPSLNLYQLDAPPLSPSSVLKGS